MKILSIAIAVSGAIFCFTATMAAAQQTRCGSDLKDVGVVSEVYADEIATFTCDGGFGPQISKNDVMGRRAMRRSDGLFFLPEIGRVVDSLDVAVSEDVQVKMKCQDVAAADRGAAATGMGHGGCE